MGRKIMRCLFLGLMLAVFVLVLTDSTVWTEENVITIGPIDSLAFQELVDSVAPGTTIKCRAGLYPCYQEDPGNGEQITFPIRITKPLRIVAADENNPPIFEGTFDPEYTAWEGGNNGFLVYNLIPDIEGLEFVGLHFQGFSRGLAFSPSYDPAHPTEPIWAGVLSNLRIVRCQFSECWGGIAVWDGQIKNFEISDNIIDDVRYGILGMGGVDEIWGELVWIGRPKNGTINGNTVTNAKSGIDVSGCEEVNIHDNFVHSSVGGIMFGGDWKGVIFPDEPPYKIGSVFRNNVQSWEGIVCYGLTPLHKSLVQNNYISDANRGISLERNANNFIIVNNEFLNSSICDIWFTGAEDEDPPPPATHDNKVIANRFITSVIDHGTNNKLVGKIDLIPNSSVLNDVCQNLKELRQKLTEQR